MHSPADQAAIDAYLAGPALLRRGVDGLTAEEFNALPIPGTWSIRQVVRHLADSEMLYAERIQRVLADDHLLLMKAEPDRYLAALAVADRNVSDELALMEAIRRHIAQILAALPAKVFDRVGIHSTDGPMTLRTVLGRVTAHLPHHVAFIEAKRERLAARS